MCGSRIGKRGVVMWASRIGAYFLFLYLTTYFLMMEPRLGARDPQTWNEAYKSTYRFAPIEQIPFSVVDLTIIVPTSCWANNLFWPVDCVVHPVLEPYHRYMLDRYKQQKEGS